MKTICYLCAIALSFILVSCGKIKLPSAVEGFSVPEIKNVAFDNVGSNLSEVAPPNVIQQLEPTLAKYQPQVSILRPQQNATIEDTTVEVSLAVNNYLLFKDDRLGMGPHLNVILDNEHYAEIYALEEPIIIQDLKPGTHTLRVLAEKPWHESFKNESAYAQTTFNVLTETTDNNPNPDLPLLTYNQPSGVYSAEPILLDFYLTGITKEDWQVRATVNEESFMIDEWQPIYLQGFQEGNNLIKLELLDESGEVIENEFNQTISLITYDETSSEQDTLAQLVTDEISFAAAVAIAEQKYYIQPVGEPEVEQTVTEELFIELPEEEEEIETVKDLSREESTDETPAEILTKDRETDEIKSVKDAAPEVEVSSSETENPEKTVESEEKTVINNIEQEEAEMIKPEEITAETTPKVVIEPQELENPEILTQPPRNKNNVSTNSVTEETASPQKDNTEILERITEIPVPEKITEEKTTNNVVTSDTEESDNIKIEIPKPKLKVPQWWKNFVVNFQQRFNINQ